MIFYWLLRWRAHKIWLFDILQFKYIFPRWIILFYYWSKSNCPRIIYWISYKVLKRGNDVFRGILHLGMSWVNWSWNFFVTMYSGYKLLLVWRTMFLIYLTLHVDNKSRQTAKKGRKYFGSRVSRKLKQKFKERRHE